MKDSVAIVSGGIDSVTMLYDFVEDIALALSFDYGALINRMEIQFAKQHCINLKIPHKIVDISFVKDNFKSSLLGDVEATDMIPFRNGIMLSIACAFAESTNLKYVMIANNADDYNVFPDCCADFINSMSDGLKFGTVNNVEIRAPYTHFSKTQIIKRGVVLHIDYSNTYSCYKGTKLHCGMCNACIKRKKAFVESYLTDPTRYE